MSVSKTFIAVLCIASALGGAVVSGVFVSVSTNCANAERSMSTDADKKFEARKNNWGPSEDF
ncbi:MULTISPECIES: hypothetical protein [Gammaproteobacteria]|uniref:hypothetical protein n=1 Tax=Gammaproteobacteria TaxID=1236 RepID=UPI000F51E8CF|nr:MULTISPECIES: hypothetical protein [Gammaproteobacteria]EAO2989496.1 hypothetical protein [Salmonella enterica subsp. enterica serovar Mbandaka]EHC5604557.1 hypothetical protein [Salmonella enterica]ELW0848835.1 hypothetical protein [Escherichia coli]ECB9090804.1 hypothetical protein [Salmonella enterica subsp. enterica serovar Mbandaka]EGI2460406.1 hypothetical protein [Salmonella enterica subsp. enterica serovar Mbandaka]